MVGMYYDGDIYIPYPSPIEKVKNSPYSYPVNTGIPRQNANGFGQYSRRQIFLPYLFMLTYIPT